MKLNSTQELNALFYGAAVMLAHRVQQDDQKLATHKSTCSRLTSVDPLTFFHSNIVPPIPIDKYLFRLCKFMRVSKAGLVISMIYIDELIAAMEDAFYKQGGEYPFLLTSYNAHR